MQDILCNKETQITDMIQKRIYTGCRWETDKYEILECKVGEKISKYINNESFRIYVDDQ